MKLTLGPEYVAGVHISTFERKWEKDEVGSTCFGNSLCFPWDSEPILLKTRGKYQSFYIYQFWDFNLL